MTTALAIDDLRSIVEQLPPNPLAGTRLAALEHLAAHGVPTVRQEDWKYTDLSGVVALSNEWLARTAPAAEPQVIDVPGITHNIDAHWLIIADGVIDDTSLASAAAAGIEVSRLSETRPDLDFAAPLADLNTALLLDGLHIRVERAVDKPIGLLLVDRVQDDVSVSQARIEIDVAANASAGFIEYHHSTGPAGHYANCLVNLAVAGGATANYVRVQTRAAEHSVTGRLAARLDRDSTFRHATFDLGGALVRNDLAIDIAAPGATADFFGVYLAGEGQHIDNHTRVDHRVGPAQSNQEYRGIATGNGRGVWNGKAIVHEGADGTDARQANHNLLLSEKAEIDAKPELEIYADDVKCSHGTTVGQLDASALYYLRTRGIGRREAERLLTHAFAHSIVAQTPIDGLAEILGALVEARLTDILAEGDA